MNILIASPNEEAYLNQAEAKAARLERLRKVRIQEKEWAKERRRQYKEASGMEWGHVILDLKDQWSMSQKLELEKLQEREREALSKLGMGMHAATQRESSKPLQISAFRQSVIRNQRVEDERFIESVKENRLEAQRNLQPILDKRALQRQIAEREHERALKAAASFRAKVAQGLITNLEIPSNPVGRRQDQSRREFMEFDETCYHRDFVAVKCEPDTGLVQRVDAWNGAVKAQEDEESRRIALQEKREKLHKKMEERHKNAIRGAHMETQKEILDKELQQILIEDRRRRQYNSGQHAAFFRNLYAEVGEAALEEKFNAQFQTEQEHIEAIVEKKPSPSNKSQFPRRPPKPMTPNLSIEFVPANQILQKKP